ncbi:MAG: AI-2E family transporter [Elusimicrobia bacterium]|nr:AI-2E family transporter [Elusimicrobiota bacterium]
MRRPFPFIPFILGAGLAFYLLSRLGHALIPFILSSALAYVTHPFINYCEVKGLRRAFSVTLFYLIALAAVSVAANNLLQMASAELSFLQEQSPAYLATIKGIVSAAKQFIAQNVPFASSIIERWDIQLYEPLMRQAENIPGYLLGIFPLLSFLFLIPLITYFMLIDGPKAVRHMIQACPARHVERILHILSEIDASLGNYLRGLLIASMAVAIASFIGLSLMGLSQALAISLLAGLGNFVPYLGPAMGAAIGGLAAIFQFNSFAAGLKVAALFAGIRLADDLLLEPFIAKRSVKLHPLAFLLSLMAGGELFGFIGLVFAVPAACVIKELGKVLWAWYATETRLAAPEPHPAVEVPYV